MQQKDLAICIIGAGPCGLTTAKNLIQSGFTSITVFEKGNQLGGNWVYDENNSHSSVYETTHIISSKKLSSFEDYPMPEHYPDYPSHRQVLAYFEAYAEQFHVKPYIQFNTCVTQVRPKADSSQWHVTYQNKEGTDTRLFDYVLIANGHHWSPSMPAYSGRFNGEILHSHQYKKALPFKGKRVLVVGAGNSACDIAVEIARISPYTVLSTRSGQHIFPKFIFGKPSDIVLSKIKWLPFRYQQSLAGFIIRVLQGRYAKYHLQKPNTKPLTTHPTINSELLYAIRHGKVNIKGKIDYFEADHVYFADGTCDTFDTIIFATGYSIHFPFLESHIVNFEDALDIPLYLKMMHPEWHNLYFIGLFQPQGCIWPLADYQAQIIARIIQGRLQRPEDLWSKIKQEIHYSRGRYQKSPRHALEVDYHQYRKQLLKLLK